MGNIIFTIWVISGVIALAIVLFHDWYAGLKFNPNEDIAVCVTIICCGVIGLAFALLALKDSIRNGYFKRGRCHQTQIRIPKDKMLTHEGVVQR
jgi:uncharacterized membrane protein YbhN (UPF0104 family)